MEQILPTIDMINTVAIYRVWHLNGLAEFLGQYGLAEFSQIPKRCPIGTNNVVVWRFPSSELQKTCLIHRKGIIANSYDTDDSWMICI